LLTVSKSKVIALWDGRSVGGGLGLFDRTLTYGAAEVGNRHRHHQYGRHRDYFDDNLRDSAYHDASTLNVGGRIKAALTTECELLHRTSLTVRNIDKGLI
jgi:hypothetical protein